MRLAEMALRGDPMMDAFCGAGGASEGYRQGGWESIVGVDNRDMSADYELPFHRTFVLGDAIEYIRDRGHLFAFIHASYPCQVNCTLSSGTNKHLDRDHPDLYTATKAALESTGRPYIMENVGGAIRRDVMLCGEMFRVPGRLGVQRHRYFELGGGLKCSPPKHPRHQGPVRGRNHGKWQEGPYLPIYGTGGGKGTTKEWQDAMGIGWTDNRAAIAQALPPAYTWWLTMNVEYDERCR